MSEPKTKGRKPSHRLFAVGGEGDTARWTEIGAAWTTRTGGFTLNFAAIPLQGRVVMRAIDEDTTEGGQQ